MSDKNDLARTQELYEFLQGAVPKKLRIADIPRLTPEQAWTVIWYLGNQYWQVPDYVEKCDVCGELYHSEQSGECLDFGDPPYSFCDNCMTEEAAEKKRIEQKPSEGGRK